MVLRRRAVSLHIRPDAAHLDAMNDLIVSSTERQNGYVVAVARVTQGAGPLRTTDLVEIEALQIKSLAQTVDDIERWNRLGPSADELRTADRLLGEYLTTERDLYGRLLVVVREGIRNVRAGRDWTWPDDAESRRLADELDGIGAQLDAELDRLSGVSS